MKLTEVNIREKEFHNNLQSNSEGRFQNFFYKAIMNAWTDFFNYLNLNVKNSEVLDFGCGIGPIIEKVLKYNPKKITGIDISDVSINKAKKRFKKNQTNVELIVDNCEETKFANNKFNLVYGLGILHHLQISKCISEISRILKPGGTLLFIEPLGTNPIINFYRTITPKSRSKDEHPLTSKDFDFIRTKFKKVDLKYYGFTTLLFFPLYGSTENSKIFKILIKIDQFLFNFNFFKKFAWSVLIIAKKN